MIERKTDGHPLFATSLIQLLLERGDLVRRDGRWTLDGSLSDDDIETPQGVRSIISKKLDGARRGCAARAPVREYRR